VEGNISGPDNFAKGFHGVEEATDFSGGIFTPDSLIIVQIFPVGAQVGNEGEGGRTHFWILLARASMSSIPAAIDLVTRKET